MSFLNTGFTPTVSARLTKAPIGEKMAIAGKMSAFIFILPTSLPLLGK